MNWKGYEKGLPEGNIQIKKKHHTGNYSFIEKMGKRKHSVTWVSHDYNWETTTYKRKVIKSLFPLAFNVIKI
jgi:hypothetical protein